MRLKWLLCLTLASNGLCQQISSTAASEGVANAIRKATLPFIVTNEGELSGVGGKLMIEAVARARFVLIGETHFSRETPQLAAAVCKTMRPDAYAVEAAPSAAEYVQTILKSPGRIVAMQERERTFPANMAFLNNEEENDLAAACVSSGNPKGTVLWGLDQEFLGSAAVLLQHMKQQPNGPRAKAAIAVAIEKDKQSEAKARATGDFMQLFLVSANDDEIDQLQQALTTDGTEKSRQIMRDFAESRHIYRLSAAGSPDSNSERASLLKQHFLQDYRSLQERTPAPRVLLKFGDNHSWKGFNNLHQLDLGDYVAELASVERATSLHIEVLAAKGTVAALGGYARPTKTESFVLADIPDYAWLKPALETLPVTGDGKATGIVLDLRKLRAQQLAVPAEAEHFMYGYDLLVVLPEFSPANLYH